MADVKMSEFLLQYFMQLRFNNMPTEYRAQFDDYAKSDDFRGNMKHWKAHLMHLDQNGNLVQNDLPDPNGADFHLDDEEWENLFKEFQKAFRKMDANSKNFTSPIDFNADNEKARNFLNEYFGFGKLFDKVTASPAAEQQIQVLKGLLDNNQSLFTVKLSEWGVISYKDLKDGIKDKKYNTDSEFQDKLKLVAQYLGYYKDELGLSQYGFDEIERGFEGGPIDPQKLQSFKSEYDILLRKLASDDKVRNEFPSDKIKSAFDTAKQYVAYDDKNSKDYVPPKRSDELNFIEQISKDVSDTYADTLEKYIKFKGDRLYFSTEAKQIVAGIHKAELKPTDGIKAVLDKSADIEKGLMYKSPNATEHFKWFTETMGELQSTMPKAFDGALSNGRKMRAIIEEMILIAVRDGKEKEAKTAMEVLSVIKYGYTTSKIMDALKKEDLTVFSDGKLSWNKNEGVKFVTTALDKSIKTAFMGIGYGITMAGNAMWLSGNKFNGRRGRLTTKQQDWERQNATDLASRTALNNQLNAQDQNAIAVENQNKANVNQGMTGANIITDANLQQHKTNLEQAKNADTAERTRLDNIAATQQYQDAKSAVDKYNSYTSALQQLTQTINQLNTDLGNIRNELAALRTNHTMSAAEKTARATLLVQQEQQKNAELADKQQKLADANTEIGRITQNPQQWTQQQQIVQNYEQQEQAYQQQAAQTDALDNRITQWDNATKNIEELNRSIDKRNEEISTWDDKHKDKYRELMAYWDMLETGRDTHMGKMYNWGGRGLSAKAAQKKFNTQKQGYIDSYLNNYTYAA